ncbi:hypothetical protein FY034_12955 [Trichlorobacter lovleyi]|uniref:phage protease n=1 Tax=Trichlorobacter lovleyi TaxID=313985 RepID=UPI00223F11E0|nr:phage protease [Trichlorobacter lovleyi]QOX79801.1 hypothetical protein FY034_12955 [Trichlorobacter lovleyi]
MALNRQQTATRAALNFELPQSASGAPEWIPLLPGGSALVGRDGRSWINSAPEGVVSGFVTDAKDMPLDWEHATELKAPKGEEAPAAGWFKELQVREDGSVWGRIEWTSKGREAVESKAYRYISPVFMYDTATNLIIKLTSVGLTNRPNLYLPALNHEQHMEELSMNQQQFAALLVALGLAPTSTAEQALNQVAKLNGDLATALNHASQPPLDKFVPKADYDLALNRATTAETALADQEKATLETAINAEIDTALKAGKITPATKEYHIAQCRQEGGLDRFKAFCQAAPTVAADTNLDKKKAAEGETALNAEESQMAAMFGNTADDIAKYGKGA